MTTGRLHYLSLWEWHTRNTSKRDSVAGRSRIIADSTLRGTDQLVATGAAARLALVRGTEGVPSVGSPWVPAMEAR